MEQYIKQIKDISDLSIIRPKCDILNEYIKNLPEKDHSSVQDLPRISIFVQRMQTLNTLESKTEQAIDNLKNKIESCLPEMNPNLSVQEQNIYWEQMYSLNEKYILLKNRMGIKENRGDISEVYKDQISENFPNLEIIDQSSGLLKYDSLEYTKSKK